MTNTSIAKNVNNGLKNHLNKNYEKDDDLFNVMDMVQATRDQFFDVPNMFDNMFDDTKKPLYPGCKKFTKLLALLRLYNLKVRFRWSNSSFFEFLSIISDPYLKIVKFQFPCNEAKKTFGAIGLCY